MGQGRREGGAKAPLLFRLGRSGKSRSASLVRAISVPLRGATATENPLQFT